MKYIYLTLSSLIIAYIIVVIFIYFYQRNLLYLPSENNYQNDKIQFNYDEVFLKVNDEIILKAINGEEIKIKKVNGIVYINEAEVVTADVEVSNGVIHFINRVLQPLN